MELHRRLGGNPEIDVPFQWLYYFFEEDDNRIEEIREDYKSGKILSGELKQLLVDKLNDFLEDHRRKRDEAKDLVNTFKYDGKLARSMWEKLHE